MITFSQQNIFQTYLKSSIRCGVRGLPTAEQRYRNVNFYFNDLRKLLLHAIHMIPCTNLDDSTVVDNGTYNTLRSSTGLKLLYGVFQNSGLVITVNHTNNTIKL